MTRQLFCLRTWDLYRQRGRHFCAIISNIAYRVCVLPLNAPNVRVILPLDTFDLGFGWRCCLAPPLQDVTAACTDASTPMQFGMATAMATEILKNDFDSMHM